MKYTHDDTFVNLDDELDESDRFEGPVEKDKKEVRKKVWRRTGNGQWEGERGLDVRYNEQFTGAGLYLSKRRSGIRLNSFDEADLIRASRAGDRAAGEKLVEANLWLIRGIAGNQKKHGKLVYGRAFYGPSFDDKVAAGVSGFWNAIGKYDLRHNTRLSTYAVHWIMKSIGAECERWRYRGMGGQTRADRVLFSDTKLTAEELAAKTECSPKSAEDAIRRLEMKELPYNSRESGNDDDDGHFVTDEDWEGIKVARGREWRGQDFYDQTVSNLRTGWKGERHYFKHWRAHELNTQPEIQGYRVKYQAALKPISRELYAGDQAKAHRDASALLALRNLLPPQGFLERLTDQLDRDAARRLSQIGRRAYAIELVERDRIRIAARSEKTQYLYRHHYEKKEIKYDRQDRIRGNAAISIRGARVSGRSNGSGRTTRPDLAQLHLQAGPTQRPAAARIAQ